MAFSLRKKHPCSMPIQTSDILKGRCIGNGIWKAAVEPCLMIARSLPYRLPPCPYDSDQSSHFALPTRFLLAKALIPCSSPPHNDSLIERLRHASRAFERARRGSSVSRLPLV